MADGHDMGHNELAQSLQLLFLLHESSLAFDAYKRISSTLTSHLQLQQLERNCTELLWKFGKKLRSRSKFATGGEE